MAQIESVPENPGQASLVPLPEKANVLVSPLPAWLSGQVAANVSAWLASGGGPISFSFSRGERKVLARRNPIPVSEWAERFRIVEMSSIPGRWKNLFTPYLCGIMDACGTPGVETVIICKSPQTGGSEAGHNLVGWCVDRSPGPVMYVFPDEITARENARDRIIPMITGSRRLSQYMTGSCDDTSSLRINLAHMPIYLGWSGSVSRLGNKPIRTLILDELDKYKNPKNEATSEALAEKRTTTWRNRRHILKISTPTTEDGPIWQAFQNEASHRFDYWVACPHCGIYQLMEFERIAWPNKESDGEPKSEDVLARRLAYYPCSHCGAIWNDADRDRATRRGEWRDRQSGLGLAACLATAKPVKIAFHVPAWLSYFVSLSEVAAAAIKCRETGRLEDIKNLQNQYKAEPWKVEIASRDEDAILALCDDRPRGTVPSPAAGRPRIACLLAGVDTQKGHFRYVIRAFGYGENEESWLVQAGVADTFAALDQLLWQSAYRDGSGQEYRVSCAMIDAMGSRTSEVYRYAIANRGRVFPWQGVRSMTQPYTPAPQEYYPDLKGNKVRIPGGMNLWRCDVTFFKNDLAHKLQIHPDDPGAFHLHSNEKGELVEYSREMCAEVWDDEEKAWINPKKRPNHFWDCEVMCLALAYIHNIRSLTPPQPRKQGKSKKPAIPETATERLARMAKWR